MKDGGKGAWYGILDQLSRMPDVAMRLLEDHSRDCQGYCKGCGRPGLGTPYKRYPCSLASIALAALDVHLQRQSRISPDAAVAPMRQVVGQ